MLIIRHAAPGFGNASIAHGDTPMFHKKTLSLSIAMIAALGSSFGVNAQAQDEQIEEIVVTGIRASLTKGLDIKRNSFQIVDSIVAEDIGKFPDKDRKSTRLNSSHV